MFAPPPLGPKQSASVLRFVPSGFSTRTVTLQVPLPIVTPVTPTPRCSPAAPLKVTRPFWPTRLNANVGDRPPGFVASATSSDSVSVADPVFVPCGSTNSVYVPFTGSVATSISPPLGPKQSASVLRFVPYGFSTRTVTLQVPLPIVTPVTPTPRCSPAAPLKVTRPFWPTRLNANVGDRPPGFVASATSSRQRQRRRPRVRSLRIHEQ